MMHGLEIKSGTTLLVEFTTYKENALADADALPTGVLWINGAAVDPTVTITGHGDAPAGVYAAQVTVTGDGGAALSPDDRFHLTVMCSIDGKPQRETIASGIVASGPVNVQFTPITSNVSAGDVVGDHFAAFAGCAGSVTIVVTAEGDLPDLTGVDLEFIVEPTDAVADQFIKTSLAGQVSAGGPDGNQVTVLWLKTDFTAIGTYQYSLIEPRADDEDRLWARGTVTVERVAIRDA
jgi:hypothetical protein